MLQCFEVDFGEFGLGEFGKEADFARDFVFGEVLFIDVGELFLDGALGGILFWDDEDDDFFAAEFVFATDSSASVDLVALHSDILNIGWVDVVAITDNHALEA